MRSGLLALASAAFILSLAVLPGIRPWIGNLADCIRLIPSEFRSRAPAARMQAKLALNYTIPMQMAPLLRANDVLLLPPEEYVSARLTPRFSLWTDPRYFYFLVGRHRTVTVRSPNVNQATCTIEIETGGASDAELGARFVRFNGPEDVARALSLFAGKGAP